MFEIPARRLMPAAEAIEVVIECLLRFELKEPTDDTRVLYFAAFVQGLCFANHHVLGLLMLAPAAPTVGRVFARRGFIGLMGHVAFPILGFSAYAYVPIRASQTPRINFGDAYHLRNLYWMVNADPYWGPAYMEPPAGHRAHGGADGRIQRSFERGSPADPAHVSGSTPRTSARSVQSYDRE
jgi:hypothetical protein